MLPERGPVPAEKRVDILLLLFRAGIKTYLPLLECGSVLLGLYKAGRASRFFAATLLPVSNWRGSVIWWRRASPQQ